MVTQNLFMKFIQCDHITCNVIILSPFHILFIYILFHGPKIDNPTSCDRIMNSTLVCFHPQELYNLKMEKAFQCKFILTNFR
jgi:hypothetical protein